MFHLNDSAICFFPLGLSILFKFFFVLYSRQVINIIILFHYSISMRREPGGGGSVVACGHATYNATLYTLCGCSRIQFRLYFTV